MTNPEFLSKGGAAVKSHASRRDAAKFPAWLQEELAAAEQDLVRNGPVSQDELEGQLGLLFEDLEREASAGRLKP